MNAQLLMFSGKVFFIGLAMLKRRDENNNWESYYLTQF